VRHNRDRFGSCTTMTSPASLPRRRIHSGNVGLTATEPTVFQTPVRVTRTPLTDSRTVVEA
jgi:hypothetical protein